MRKEINKRTKPKKPLGKYDLREIDPAYYNSWINYSIKESELFKKPTRFKHFKKRIEILIKRKESNTLVFLPKGDGIFLKALKLYVLNLIPTKKRHLAQKIYVLIYDKIGPNQFREMVNKYAKYIKKFKRVF
jgi:hypothetical protein